ncbi:hypothetical protein [Tuwongella immobilis]|uniref:Hypothetical conserved protein n=1 Tax=Tuwongella immobilis TaxID=692036 RepID=A0A6C2YIR3_9BACT|nr:hypothetical protein [Tuwongella immobilis]VIP01023.1 Hypothetical conserved protein OS=uncultured planctomycete GN=HGMM_F12C05C09 PE=4 SV=1 [Tuwongella immobilis]VTR97471.1 Hypothetical conserved protein OS=uncultured planctomycete GN=HGMM_F12C05C09 PE=4 SV=1 [Tuwongella immobilis]
MSLPKLSELIEYVRQTLCGRDHLDPAQTPFFGAPIYRGTRITGVVYHVEGPRLLQTSALWTADENRILFYDSTGQRFHETRLLESPDIREALPRYAA